MEVRELELRVEDLRNDWPGSEAALSRLGVLLTAVAWFELERRRTQVLDLSSAQVARLVRDAGERAGAALLQRLGDYHGQSRFEVWAAKFAIHETAAAARRHTSTTSHLDEPPAQRRR
jgi:hypothetical protein